MIAGRAALASFLRAAGAEALKEARLHWGRRGNLALEAVVPALHFAFAFYMFAPFAPQGRERFAGGSDDDTLLLWLLVGFLGYYVFQRLLWSSMERAYRERDGSTLELLFLSPASRMGLLVGGAASGMLRAAWLYVAFFVGAALAGGGFRVAHAGSAIVALLALLLPALAFGTLLHGFLLFARDTSAYVTLSQPVFGFLSGMRFPVAHLPPVLQAVSAALPLTWALRAARPLLIEGAAVRDVAGDLALAGAFTIGCFALAAVAAHRGEAAAKRTGSLVLY